MSNDLESLAPVVIELVDGNLQCPCCGNITDLQNYDCLGADMEADVFCNQCHEQLRLP